MTTTVDAVVIRGALNSTDALCVVASLTGDVEVDIETELIYPYHCFDAHCSVPTLAGRKLLSLVCLVDAINGLGATADAFELQWQTVPVATLMAATLGDDEAVGIASRTVAHHLGRKLRTITSFDVDVRARGLVHKRFWIIRSSEARVMVDSTTGNLHPLKLRAA